MPSVSGPDWHRGVLGSFKKQIPFFIVMIMPSPGLLVCLHSLLIVTPPKESPQYCEWICA